MSIAQAGTHASEAGGIQSDVNSALSIVVPDIGSTHTAERSVVGDRPTFYRRLGKRALDLTVGSALVMGVAPIMVSVWFCLRLTLGRGVILRQERVGLDGRPFAMLKFRTMESCRRRPSDKCDYEGEDRRLTHKCKTDPRHTPLGRIIRRFSLDELPQLLNIVFGDMSLVGPRPELTSNASDQFLRHQRHTVRPGLTGPYQTSPLRLTGLLEPGLGLDEIYVSEVSLLTDIRYVVRTVKVLARGTGS